MGNTVVAFEGHTPDFPAGCAETDMLILDDAMLPLLRPDWAAMALEALRQPRIITFGRDGRLSKLTRLVEVEQQPGEE